MEHEGMDTYERQRLSPAIVIRGPAPAKVGDGSLYYWIPACAEW